MASPWDFVKGVVDAVEDKVEDVSDWAFAKEAAKQPSVTVKTAAPKPVAKKKPTVKPGTTWTDDKTGEAIPTDEGNINPIRSLKELGKGAVTGVGFIGESLVNQGGPTFNPMLGSLIKRVAGQGDYGLLDTILKGYDEVVPPEESQGRTDDYAASAARLTGEFLVPGGAVGKPGRFIKEAIGGGVTSGVAGERAAERAREDGLDPEMARLLFEILGGGVGVIGTNAASKKLRDRAGTVIVKRGAARPEFPKLVETIIDLEGGGTLANPKTSPKGAMGVMQVMPETARKPGYGIRPWDGKSQEDLARVGRDYAAAMSQKYNGDTAKILAAYNGGPGRVDSLVRKHGDDWWKHLPEETRNYIENGLKKFDNVSGTHVARDGLPGNQSVRPMEPDELTSIMDNDRELTPEELDLVLGKDNRADTELQLRRRDEVRPGDEDADVLTPAERQEMDASVPEGPPPSRTGRPADNFHEKFTPNKALEEAANDEGKFIPVKDSAKKSIKTGEPVEVEGFHGTSDDFDSFDMSKAGEHTNAPSAREAAWFGTRKNTALYYSKSSTRDKNRYNPDYLTEDGRRVPLDKLAKESGKLARNWRGKPIRVPRKSVIKTATIKMENPLVVDMGGKVYREESYYDILKRAQEAGHDGVVLKNAFDAGEYSKFDVIFNTVFRHGYGFNFRGETLYATFRADNIKNLSTVKKQALHKRFQDFIGKLVTKFKKLMENEEGSPAERQEMDASVPEGPPPSRTGRPADNFHEKFTPNKELETPANDLKEYNINPEDLFVELEKPGQYGVTYHHPSGVKVTADFTHKGDGVFDVDIGGLGNDSNILGPGMTRKLLRAVQKEIPELKSINAERITGARMDNPQYTNINLKKEELAEPPVRDQNPPAASRTAGTKQPKGPRMGRPEQPRKSDEGHPEGPDPANEGLDPEQKLIKAIKKAKPVSGQQRAAYHEERARRAMKLKEIQERGGSLPEQMAALRGELPKADYESIAHNFTEQDLHELTRKINTNNWLQPYEKMNALKALTKLLGAEGAKVPTNSEIKLLSHVFSEDFVQALLKNRPFAAKFWDGLGQAANLPRALMASMDLSAPFRQGIFMIGRKQFWNSFAHMFKLVGSEKAFKALEADIRERPTADLMRRAGLVITDMDHFMSNREEAFMSNWAEKIPVVGRAVHASNRAYTGFLNKLRADVFDSLIESGRQVGKSWETDGKALKDLGKFINAATGRGSLGKFEQSAPVLNAVFFSPRLVTSRLTMLNPYTYATLDPFVRKEALKSAMTFGGIAMTILGLAKMGGASVEVDPRSSDFGKIRIGDTRYDIGGGFNQYITFGARLATGKTKNSKGKVKNLEKKGFGDRSRADVSYQFIRNKFSPTLAYFWNAMDGQNPVGEEFHAGKDAVKSVIPLAAQDIADLYNEEGMQGIAKGSPAIFGVGVQTYKPRPSKGKKPKNEWESTTADDWSWAKPKAGPQKSEWGL